MPPPFSPTEAQTIRRGKTPLAAVIGAAVVDVVCSNRCGCATAALGMRGATTPIATACRAVVEASHGLARQDFEIPSDVRTTAIAS
jgi:hypothetical protein